MLIALQTGLLIYQACIFVAVARSIRARFITWNSRRGGLGQRLFTGIVEGGLNAPLPIHNLDHLLLNHKSRPGLSLIRVQHSWRSHLASEWPGSASAFCLSLGNMSSWKGVCQDSLLWENIRIILHKTIVTFINNTTNILSKLPLRTKNCWVQWLDLVVKHGGLSSKYLALVEIPLSDSPYTIRFVMPDRNFFFSCNLILPTTNKNCFDSRSCGITYQWNHRSCLSSS